MTYIYVYVHVNTYTCVHRHIHSMHIHTPSYYMSMWGCIHAVVHLLSMYNTHTYTLLCQYSEYQCVYCIILHMSVTSQDGWSAVIYAALNGRTEVVQELVMRGADLNLQDEVCQYIRRYMMFTTVLVWMRAQQCKILSVITCDYVVVC